MDKKEKTLLIGLLLLPIIILISQGIPPQDEEGRLCFSAWKSHFLETRFLVIAFGIVALFLFKNWFFKVFVFIVMLMTAFFTYVSGWIWADAFC
ncbi:MAG: hypothetical protein LAT76_08185 [Schleiferiaceae bacterium]|nr:hypothetical protein [Schleiferiaceae bacterium]